MIRTQRIGLILSGLVTFLGSGSAFAFTYTVPTHFPTIQGAINAATNGDKIRIAPGTYRENLFLNGKNITLEPVNAEFSAIIDGQGAPCITLSGGELPTAVIKGLTLQNGGGTNGGGIKSGNSLATIKNCVIQDNHVTGNGGGIYGHSGLISGCRIIDNTATQGAGISNSDGTILSNHISRNIASQSGGGIANSSGDISFNTIKLNEAAVRGGGIADSSGNIRGNLIQENEATTAGTQANPGSFGAGLANCTGLIEQNRITGNASNGNGGGLDSCTSTVRNNVIDLNTARHGGGISNSQGRIEHNVIYGNYAFFAGGGIRDSVSPLNSIIWANNTAGSGAQISSANGPLYSCVQDWMGGGTGVLNVDPQFVNAAKGDFHLQPTSPLIDAGGFTLFTLNDFEDEPRGTTGTLEVRGDGSRYDIGADEYIPPFINLTGTWTMADTKVKVKKGVTFTTVKGKLSVNAVGNIPSGVVTDIRYYLSTDATWDGGDQEIGLPKTLKSMKPGTAKAIKLKVKLPAGQSASGMHLIAVVDSPNLVLESNESDNYVIGGPLP